MDLFFIDVINIASLSRNLIIIRILDTTLSQSASSAFIPGDFAVFVLLAELSYFFYKLKKYVLFWLTVTVVFLHQTSNAKHVHNNYLRLFVFSSKVWTLFSEIQVYRILFGSSHRLVEKDLSKSSKRWVCGRPWRHFLRQWKRKLWGFLCEQGKM